MKNTYVPFVSIISFFLVTFPVIIPQTAKSQAQNSPPPRIQKSDKIMVTAIVPLSDLWADSISQESRAEVNKIKGIGQETTFTLQVRGLKGELMKKQAVRAHIAKDGELVSVLEGVTDNLGKAHFAFIPESGGKYEVFFTNDTYEYVVEIEDSLVLNIPRDVF